MKDQPNELLSKVCGDLALYLRSVYSDWDGGSQLEGTGKRIARMYTDFCWSPGRIETELAKHFKTHKNAYGQMLTERNIRVSTLCPHHLLPCSYSVSIGYIPKGGVLGLSKFVRIATVVAKRPIMQEQYTMELATVLDEKLKPDGLGVYVVGTHGCMASRGVLQEVPVITTNLKGCFMTEPATRAEFLQSVRSSHD